MTDEPTFDLNAAGATRWKLDIRNRVEPMYPERTLGPLADVSFEATLACDMGTFEMIAGHPALSTYTVQYAIDHNPWHRSAQGVRARARKVGDGIWWTFQRRILRRSLVVRTTISVPDCSIISAPVE